jgi:hypothetical protein
MKISILDESFRDLLIASRHVAPFDNKFRAADGTEVS